MVKANVGKHAKHKDKIAELASYAICKHTETINGKCVNCGDIKNEEKRH